MAIALFEGLLGGAVYVNAFYRIAIQVILHILQPVSCIICCRFESNWLVYQIYEWNFMNTIQNRYRCRKRINFKP